MQTAYIWLLFFTHKEWNRGRKRDNREVSYNIAKFICWRFFCFFLCNTSFLTVELKTFITIPWKSTPISFILFVYYLESKLNYWNTLYLLMLFGTLYDLFKYGLSSVGCRYCSFLCRQCYLQHRGKRHIVKRLEYFYKDLLIFFITGIFSKWKHCSKYPFSCNPLCM